MTKHTKQAIIVSVIILLVLCAGGIVQGAEQADAGATILAKDVSSWKVLAGGIVRVVRKDGGVRFFDPATGKAVRGPAGDRFQVSLAEGKITVFDPKTGKVQRVHDEKKPIREVFPISRAVIGYEVHGENFTMLHLGTGRATVCVSGGGNYEAFAVKPGRGWFMVMAIRMMPKINFEFHRVDLRTGETSKVYETGDRFGVEQFNVTDDGTTLVVVTESGSVKTLIKRTVDMRLRTVVVENVPRFVRRKSFPLVGAQGRVAQEKDSLFLVRGGRREDLFPGLGRAWVIPNDKNASRWLKVGHIVDSNKDGNIAREDGDWIEIWVLDLATIEKKRLADTACENIGRGWTKDGAYIVYNRIRRPKGAPGSYFGDIMLHEAVTGKTHTLRADKEANYIWFKRAGASGGVFAAFERHAGRQLRGVRLEFFDLRTGKRTVLCRGNYSWKVQKAGKYWVIEEYSRGGKTTTLYRWTPPAPEKENK